MCCKSQDISRGIRRLGKKSCKFGSEIARDGDFFMPLDGIRGNSTLKIDRSLRRNWRFFSQSPHFPDGARRESRLMFARTRGRLSSRVLPCGVGQYCRMRM